MTLRTIALVAVAALAGALLAGCSGSDDSAPAATDGNGSTTGHSSASGTSSQAASNPYPIPSSTTTLAGSGATFPGPLIESWAIQFGREHSKVQVSYAKKGSGAGRTDLFNKDVFFAGSDAPLTPQQKADNPGILQFPETLGAIAMGYNVNGVTGLRLDGETIGKIYTGDVKKWNDPAIAAQNPGKALPSSDIVPVRRSDSSGTTFAWSDFLAKTSASWRAKFGSSPATSFDWTKSSTTPLAGNGNDGVADLVQKTPNSIGYMELAYISAKGLKASEVKAHDGAYLAPTIEGASEAAANSPALPAVDGDWSTVSIVDAPGASSYPISTYTYMLVYQSLSSYGGKATQDQQDAFQAWMWWCLHDGQSYSKVLGYAPLPSKAVDLGDGALASLTA